MTPRSLNLHILSDFAHVYGRFFSSKSACVTSRDQNEQSKQSSQLAKEEEEHIDNWWTREESSERWTREELSAFTM